MQEKFAGNQAENSVTVVKEVGGSSAAAADVEVEKNRGLLKKKKRPCESGAAFVPPPLPPNIVNQGWIRFLLSKKLQNTDVGPVGRIVLPKKPTEARLPMLLDNKSIILLMYDMHAADVWSFKFRYWPNNRSRMYVLEGTGAFTKKHGLQTGDYMLLYLDLLNHNYMIRAVRANEVEGCANKEVTAVSENKEDEPLTNDADFMNLNTCAPGGTVFKPFNLVDHPTNFPTTVDQVGLTSMDNDGCFFDFQNSFSSWDELMTNYPATRWSNSFENLSDEDLSKV